MLKGRLGLATARIPHKDRHGLVWLSRGALVVEDGTLHFRRNAEPSVTDPLKEGDYTIPFQMVSMILLGPGSTVSHDALRLCARHGTAIAAVGEDGVRAYTAPPLIPDRSGFARRQARVWADAEGVRLDIARRMYAWRLGEILPHEDIATLRGIEGARVKEMYKLQAQRFGTKWNGRHYDRANPNAADLPNQALNHAASAVEGAAAIAVTATATIPQLGFIHEDSGQSFVLDIADLFRDAVTVPVAFKAAKEAQAQREANIERLTRQNAGFTLRKEQVIEKMIDRIKQLFGDPEDGRAGERPAEPEGGTEGDAGGEAAS